MSRPLVTLGVAAYNEEHYIRESLENLIAQTYPHLEILIGDNGSTDATTAICEEFAQKDHRIRLIRHPQNIGQNSNFNTLAKEAKGTYFAWISGHDLLDPDFVEQCVNVLESDPNAVLACPKTVYMTVDGQKKGEKPRPFDITKMNAQRRFRETMWRVDCNFVYGMFRRSAMLETGIFQLLPAADRVFLSEMAIRGTFVPVNTAKYYRDNRGGAQTEMEKRHRLMRYIFPTRSYSDAELSGNGFYTPTVNGFYRAVTGGHFSLPTRVMLYANVWLCSLMKFHLFPGADAMSAIVKRILPQSVLDRLMKAMR